ncbi:unnamed protein product [Diatraea saccharalis]|uniref:E3 ubiquitin-protein ligase APD1-4 N-terminal domain-containing protein n=1 Tax=Diatraea saccharalis TaxID=40085 RepID=A0A9N9RAM2_9NEOP|nr:unnamed protein product [Diatraea saccharalis]
MYETGIMESPELVPLEAGVIRPRLNRHCSRLASRDCYRGPIKICRLLALLIFLPSVFIFMPLYMRYRVFSGQMYPMSMTDMRLIDGRISTTWCQRQVVRSNTTFNAFVVPGPPELTDELVPVSMTRELELKDDMKEYWGFYLLKGSTVTVSTCVRWPGASLIMIKGYKHLHECAYIGDDSSEELDELMEANKLGLISDALLLEKIQELKKVDGKANHPDTMKRHKAGVSFHDPSHTANVTSPESVPTADVTEQDPKELRELLERLHALRQAAKDELMKHYQPPSHLVSLPSLHRHRDTNVDKDEIKWISFTDIDGKKNKTNIYTDTAINVQPLAIDPKSAPNEREKEINDTHASIDNYKISSDKKVQEKKITIKENSSIGIKEDVTKYTTEEISTMSSSIEQESSREIFEDVFKRLRALGDRGKRVLARLHETMDVEYNRTSNKPTSDIMSTVKGSEEELDSLRNILVEAIDEEKNRVQRKEKRRYAQEDARAKRELMLGQIELQKQFNEDDEARDYAAEEDLQPDGYAEHHEQVNETTAFDMSNSEFWSSFSSSEEALLECEGLILNLPLTPHSSCHKQATDSESFSASRANALTYR